MDLREMWKDGKSVRDIARELGRDYFVVRREMIADGIFTSGEAMDRFSSKKTKERSRFKRLVKKYRDEGETVRWIANELGVHIQTVYRAIDRS